jgi:hypothetical protein
MLPIAIPPTSEHQRPQRRQRVTGLDTPVHPRAFLPLCHNQIVGFFDMSTADVLARLSPRPIVGDVGLPLTQIDQQFLCARRVRRKIALPV